MAGFEPSIPSLSRLKDVWPKATQTGIFLPDHPKMLDFSQVTTQIRRFASDRESALPRLQAALQEAGDRLRRCGPDWQATGTKIQQSHTSWLLADWLEPPDVLYEAPPRPMPHTILATDGSQIVSDRHDIALCYLLNIGFIAIPYGGEERPTLTSRPTLAFPEEDLLAVSESDQTMIAPRRLAIKRLLGEFCGLIEMLSMRPAGEPVLALSDGTLILWMLETETEAFLRQSLSEFQGYLDTLRIRRTPVVGYISQPQSRDVVNSLRVFACPFELAHCDRNCPHHQKQTPHYEAPPCVYSERIKDHELFETILKPGQRSAIFASRSKIFQYYRLEHRVAFFYLHTGREVARVEIPLWVAQDTELLVLTHALCYDQALKGDGYPVALAEAHEQAIVRGPERQAFFHLMEREFVRTRQPLSGTQKAVSKRARRI